MSYDVSIGSEWLNYTSNLAALFHDHIPAQDGRGGLDELNGKTGKQCLPILAAAFHRLNDTYCTSEGAASFRAKYDAPNGWGSTDGALIFLARIMAACAANPRKKLDISA